MSTVAFLSGKNKEEDFYFDYGSYIDALEALKEIQKEEQGEVKNQMKPRIRVVEINEETKNIQPAKNEVIYNLNQVRSILTDIVRRYGKHKENSTTLADMIIKEALIQNYDPLFVAAVIKSESAFNHLAKSHVGATGLMQIMPATWKVIERFEDFSPVKGASLTDPDYNLRLGIRYLRYLDQMFKDNKVLVLIAYNWGPGRVLDAFRGKRRVPPEVINYATKILNDYHSWVKRSLINRTSQ